jgi:hypothetical protein
MTGCFLKDIKYKNIYLGKKQCFPMCQGEPLTSGSDVPKVTFSTAHSRAYRQRKPPTLSPGFEPATSQLSFVEKARLATNP